MMVGTLLFGAAAFAKVAMDSTGAARGARRCAASMVGRRAAARAAHLTRSWFADAAAACSARAPLCPALRCVCVRAVPTAARLLGVTENAQEYRNMVEKPGRG
jgi:hypothetical protein